MSDWLGQPSGGFVGNSAQDTANVHSSWHIVGTGDFNGDGMADVLWRNDNGTVSDWLGQSNGGFVGNSAQRYVSSLTAGTSSASATSTAMPVDDVLWRNDNGQLTDWLGPSNGSFIGNSAQAVVVPTNWHIQDPFVHDPFPLA